VAETAFNDPGVIQGAYTSAGYLGMSDSNGRFIWQSTVSNWTEGHTYQFWVGYWDGSGVRPATDIVGSVEMFAQDASGNPSAPSGLASIPNQEGRSNRLLMAKG
jgi:hypothetical protein